MSKQAKVIRKQTGEQAEWQVRLGAKGTGRRVGPVVKFWPNSDRSVEAAENTVRQIVEQAGVEIRWW